MNYHIGLGFELRLLAYLRDFDTVSRVWKASGRYPDLFFELMNGDIYGVECKTIKEFYSNGRRGYAKISYIEMHETTTQQEFMPCMIVELRTEIISKRKLLFIEWEKVLAKYSKTEPSMMSITWAWCIRNGTELKEWLDSQ